MNKKILIVVLSFDKEPYVSLENTIRNTWAREKPEGVEIIYYYGNSKEDKLLGDKLYLNSPEGLRNVSKKTLKMYEYVFENFEFDYVYRTNSSSYVNITKLKEFIVDKPLNKFYSGVVGNSPQGIKFASGSGYFISHDLIELVLNNKNKWDNSLIDDVALGKLLSHKNIKITRGTRINLTKNHLNNTPFDKNAYHYRVKFPNNRQIDIKLMKKIYNALKS